MITRIIVPSIPWIHLPLTLTAICPGRLWVVKAHDSTESTVVRRTLDSWYDAATLTFMPNRRAALSPRDELGAARLARRRFLTGTGAAAWLAATGTLTGVTTPTAAAQGAGGTDPFRLGVASGDPLPDGVVLWTRLVPEPFDPFGGMAARDETVRWQVAEDAGFRRVVRS